MSFPCSSLDICWVFASTSVISDSSLTKVLPFLFNFKPNFPKIHTKRQKNQPSISIPPFPLPPDLDFSLPFHHVKATPKLPQTRLPLSLLSRTKPISPFLFSSTQIHPKSCLATEKETTLFPSSPQTHLPLLPLSPFLTLVIVFSLTQLPTSEVPPAASRMRVFSPISMPTSAMPSLDSLALSSARPHLLGLWISMTVMCFFVTRIPRFGHLGLRLLSSIASLGCCPRL